MLLSYQFLIANMKIDQGTGKFTAFLDWDNPLAWLLQFERGG